MISHSITKILFFLILSSIIWTSTKSETYSKYYTDGIPNAVYISDSTLYIGAGGALKIFSCSNLSEPVLLSQYSLPSSIRDIYYENKNIYLLADSLYLFSFTDEIKFLNKFPITGNKVIKRGDIIFILTNLGLSSIDISDINNIALLDTVLFDYFTNDISISGNYAYAATAGGLYKVDISAPRNMEVKSLYETSSGFDVFGVCTFDNYIYATVSSYGNNILILEASNDENLNLAKITGVDESYTLRKIIAYSGKLYITDCGHGFYCFDLSIPDEPILITKYSSSSVNKISVNNIYAAILKSCNIYNPKNIEIIDLTTLPPQKVSEIEIIGSYGNLIAKDNIVFVYVKNRQEIEIIDFSSSNPKILDSLNTPEVYSLLVNNNYLFIGHTSGLTIYDVAIAYNPIFISSVTLASPVLDMIIRDTIAFIGTGGGLKIFNLSDINNPQPIGEYLKSSLGRLALNGDYVYLANPSPSFDIACSIDMIDISNLYSPKFISEYYFDYRTGRDIWDMLFKNNLLFIVNWNCLSIYKTVSPTDLVYCSNYYYGTVYPENRKAIQVINKTVFGIADYTGLHILNVDDPYSVKELKSYKFPDMTYSVYANNEKIYVSSMNNGVYEIDNTFLTNVNEQNKIPNQCLLLQNYPNPFNPNTKIEYSIPKSSFVTLKVYDILGREIATLVNEEKQTGNYDVEFFTKGGSASGGNGKELPSGIYFYKLQAGDYIESRKMVLMK